jgi:sulfur dioxygenase
MIFRQFFDYETWTYSYLLADTVSGEAVLIDPVLEQVERDLSFISQLNLKLKFTLETHVHADHITGADQLRTRTGAKVALSAAAKVNCADLALQDGQELTFGPYKIKCITTPGHTNSCMSFYCEGMVFTGDVLFVRDVGRTDFQEGSPESMFNSITKKLFVLPDQTLVYPAHDYKGQTVSTIGEEKKYNAKLGNDKKFEHFKALVDAMKLGQPKKIHIAVPANLNCGKL